MGRSPPLSRLTRSEFFQKRSTGAEVILENLIKLFREEEDVRIIEPDTRYYILACTPQ
jgi:hypothetical protein